MAFFIFNMVVGIFLAFIAHKLKYKKWQIAFWFLAGLVLNVLAVILFISAYIVARKRCGLLIFFILLLSVIFLSLKSLMIFFPYLSFSELEGGLSIVFAILLIIVGIIAGLSSETKKTTLEHRLHEIKQFHSLKIITTEEYEKYKNSILNIDESKESDRNSSWGK